MQSYMYYGKLNAKQGLRSELSEILIEASVLVSKAKGCRIYLISHEPADTSSVFVTEIWDSKEDHDNALKGDDLRQLILKALPLLAEAPTKGQELEIAGGFGF